MTVYHDPRNHPKINSLLLEEILHIRINEVNHNIDRGYPRKFSKELQVLIKLAD